MPAMNRPRAALFALCAGLPLAACGTAYDRTLDSWVGAPVASLTDSWGPAHMRFRDDEGRRVYQWSFREIGGRQTAAAFHYQQERDRTPPYCETRIFVDDGGVVRGWAWRGNDCFGTPRR